MPTPPAHSRTRSTLVFDGECGFCTAAVRWLESAVPAPPPSTPYQWADLEQLGLTPREGAEMVWLVSSDDGQTVRQYGGYLAIAMLLRHQPSLRWRFLGVLLDTLPFSILADLGYRLVARLRHRLPGITPACRADRSS